MPDLRPCLSALFPRSCLHCLELPQVPSLLRILIPVFWGPPGRSPFIVSPRGLQSPHLQAVSGPGLISQNSTHGGQARLPLMLRQLRVYKHNLALSELMCLLMRPGCGCSGAEHSSGLGTDGLSTALSRGGRQDVGSARSARLCT